MGKASRDKGRRWEQEVARRFRARGLEARRGWQSRFGSDDADVIVTGDPRLERMWFECKNGQGPSVWSAMDQAAAAAGPDRVPVVLAHRDHGRDLVVMEMDAWFALLGLKEVGDGSP